MIQRKNFAYFIVAFSIFAATFSFWFYQAWKTPNVLTQKDARETYIYIKPHWKFSPQLINYLVDNKIVDNGLSFGFISKLKGYQENIKPGRYLIQPNWNNIQIVDHLRQGNQAPVNMTFNNVTSVDELPELICEGTVAKEDVFKEFLKDSTKCAEKGFTTDNIMTMFIPNTYQVYWTYDAKKLWDRCHKEYQRFWTQERRNKAKGLNLTPQEVYILASVVYGETKIKEEQPKIAQVYLNRLSKGMRLEADPGWVYMWRNDTTADHTQKPRLINYRNIDSPANLYMHKGLPPFPLQMPSYSAIEAVLNPVKHDYIFIVSKGDGTGHYFAKTLAQHNRNIEKYRKIRNEQKRKEKR